MACCTLFPRMAPVMTGFPLVLLLAAGVLAPIGAAGAPQSPVPPALRVVLVGDSTVTEGAGWGLGFRELAGAGLEVVNTAANGRSSKSFIDEGLWAKALAAKGQ